MVICIKAVVILKWYMCNVLYCDLLDLWPDKPIFCDSALLVDFSC